MTPSLREKKERSISLELTPLIDVVFLLLIYFMVSTTFDSLHHLDLELPSISEQASETEHKNNILVIAITAQGDYQINEEKLTIANEDELYAALQNRIATTDTPIVIAGDAQAPHFATVQLLNTLGRLNTSNVQIAAIKEK